MSSSGTVTRRPEPPFPSYPSIADGLFETIWIGSNARRHGYGLRLMRLTHLHRCAYCGLDFLSSFEAWLTMQVDHVVPVSVCVKMKIDLKWCRSLANAVLACSTCNGLCNRFNAPPETVCPTSPEGFLSGRDAIFLQRQEHILKQRQKEEAEFIRQRSEFQNH